MSFQQLEAVAEADPRILRRKTDVHCGCFVCLLGGIVAQGVREATESYPADGCDGPMSFCLSAGLRSLSVPRTLLIPGIGTAVLGLGVIAYSWFTDRDSLYYPNAVLLGQTVYHDTGTRRGEAKKKIHV